MSNKFFYVHNGLTVGNLNVDAANGNLTTSGLLTTTNTTAASSTVTGALIVAGGAGIGGSLYAGNIYDNGTRVLQSVTPIGGTSITVTSVSTSNGNTTFTINNTGVTSLTGSAYLSVSASTGNITLYNQGVQTLTAGTDTAVSSTTGTVTVWNVSTLQTVTGRGATTNNALSITNSTVGSSTSTGQALLVSGGLGALKVVASEVFDGGNRVLTNVAPAAGTAISVTSVSTSNGTTSFTINNTGVTSAVGTTYLGVSASTGAVTFTNLGVQSLTAGADLSVSNSTGTITVSSTATLQSITNRGAATTNQLVITNTSATISTTTGALTVAGGVGIGGSLYVGGEIIAQKLTIQYTTVTTTLVQTDDVIQTSNATESTSTTTGALLVAGGAGIGGNVYVGGTIYSNGTALSNFSTSTLVAQAVNATNATNATNIQGGVAGQIPIQAAAGVTTFVATGTSGYVLTMGTNTATWQSLSSLSAGLASTATDVAGGTTGAILYQRAAGDTEFIGIGAAGSVLQSNGTTATYVTTASLVVGYAQAANTATNVYGGTVNGTTLQVSGVSTFSNNVIVSAYPVVYDQTGVSVGITAVTVDTFALATYRSAKYVITISNSGNTAYQSTEALVIHDGTTPYLYDTSVFTGAAPIMTFTTTINSGNVLLQGTGTATGNTVKVQRIYTTV